MKKCFGKFSIIEEIKKCILSDKNLSYYYKQKFPHTLLSLEFIIENIIFVLKTGCSWKYIKNSKAIYYHFKRFVKYKIFKKTYQQILNLYILTNDSNVHIIDTTDIKNRHGISKIGRNKYYKNKKITKLSSIVDTNGITLSVFIDSGNKYDTELVSNTINNLLVSTKHKRKMLGDRGYDSNKTRQLLQQNNYEPIIPQNIRNIKNLNKIRIFNYEETKIYKQRIKIKNSYTVST